MAPPPPPPPAAAAALVAGAPAMAVKHQASAIASKVPVGCAEPSVLS